MDFDGFSFSNYRSIGKRLIRISPLDKVNFIIGQNNIGKSNIIKFLSEKLGRLYSASRDERKSLNYDVLDFNIPDGRDEDINIGFAFSENKLDDLIFSLINYQRKADRIYQKDGLVYSAYKELLTSHAFKKSEDGKLIWLEYIYSPHQKKTRRNLKVEVVRNILSSAQWGCLLTSLDAPNIFRSGTPLDEAIDEVLSAIFKSHITIPNIIIVPAIRRVGDSSGVDINFGGEGIIQQLAKLQNPQHLKQSEREKFKLINSFVRNVLERDDAEIEIPYERDMILIHMDGKVLPLDCLGTGIHEVVILAVAATIVEDSIVCIEEPELHLHPLLQRKLIKYISDSTSNKYIFTTHSAHILDVVKSQIFHVYNKDDEFCVDSISNNSQKVNVCRDLGYKASDLLQSNCIIWVEGPSDRIYLNYWIKGKTDELIEGVHYSVMFYGGRLASNLTANDYVSGAESSTDDFVSLISLNRKLAIVLDSDKSNSRVSINDTKKRLVEEVNSQNGFSWVTAGREIENYLDADVVEECVRKIHTKSAKGLMNKGRWDNILKIEPMKKVKDKEPKVADKVSVAKMYVQENRQAYDVLDLDFKVNSLIEFIKRCN